MQTILANESLHSKDCVLKWSILLENMRRNVVTFSEKEIFLKKLILRE